jgi:hypothetical protein
MSIGRYNREFVNILKSVLPVIASRINTFCWQGSKNHSKSKLIHKIVFCKTDFCIFVKKLEKNVKILWNSTDIREKQKNFNSHMQKRKYMKLSFQPHNLIYGEKSFIRAHTVVWTSSLRGPKRRSPASSLSSGSDTAAWKQAKPVHVYLFKFSWKKE